MVRVESATAPMMEDAGEVEYTQTGPFPDPTGRPGGEFGRVGAGFFSVPCPIRRRPSGRCLSAAFAFAFSIPHPSTVSVLLRQSFWNSVISYAGAVLGMVVTLFLYPNILLPDQYGLTRLFISFSLVGAQFAHLGIRATLLRFMPMMGGYPASRHAFIRLSLAVPIAGMVLVVLFHWGAGGWIETKYAESPLFLDYRWWVVPMTLYMVYYEVLNSMLRSEHDSLTGTFAMELLNRVLVIALLWVYSAGGLSFDTFVVAFTLVYALTSVYLLAALARRGYFKEPSKADAKRAAEEPAKEPADESASKPGPPRNGANARASRWRIPRRLREVTVRYSLYSLLGGMTSLLVWNVDVMMLGAIVGLDSTAIYSVAFYMGSVMSIPMRSAERIGTPLIAAHIRRRKWREVADVYRETSLNPFLISFLAAMLLWVNIDLLFTFMPEVYAGGRWVVFWIAVGQLVNVAAGLNGSILVTSRFYRVDLAGVVLLLVLTVGMNLALIPRFGVAGAAGATCAALVVYNVFKLVYVQWKMGMQPFSKSFAVFAGVLGPVLFGLALLPVQEWMAPWLDGLHDTLTPGERLAGLDARQWSLLASGAVRSAVIVAVFLAGVRWLPMPSYLQTRLKTWIP